MTRAQEALIALLSGITKYKDDTKEIWWHNKILYPVTIELTDHGWIERQYFYDMFPDRPGQMKTYREFDKEGHQNGKSIAWYRNGVKMYENLFYNGEVFKRLFWQGSDR